MNSSISDLIWKIVACPDCGSSLHRASQSVTCSSCDTRYKYTETGSVDFRLQSPKKYQYDFTLGTSILPGAGFDFGTLPMNSNPEVEFSNYVVPYHLSREMMSYMPRAKTDHSLMLDLGCGNTVHKEVCEHAGFEYVGLDYAAKGAPILGDAHSLPFKDDSFEFILSIAVLEHIRFPFVAMKEAYRVLKPNGKLIGTVSFLEPFHMGSVYHHSHLGTYNSLQEGGFRIEKICPSSEWSALMAQASMALFPRMPAFFSKAIVLPIQLLHKGWWKLGSIVSKEASEQIRIRNTTGAFTFIAWK